MKVSSVASLTAQLSATFAEMFSRSLSYSVRWYCRLRAPLSMPQRRLGEVHLTPLQYAEYVEMSGKPARQYLEGVVVDPAWQEFTDAERRKFLRDTMTYYRKEARKVLKARYPDLGGE